MDNENTMVFDVDNINEKLVHDTLKDVCSILDERGYNSINQIVGYILSGDLGYISSYKGARKKISKLERSTLVEVLLKKFIAWDI